MNAGRNRFIIPRRLCRQHELSRMCFGLAIIRRIIDRQAGKIGVLAVTEGGVTAAFPLSATRHNGEEP